MEWLTKAQVIEYYVRVAPRMLPFLGDQTPVRTRYPDGIGTEGFYEKDAPSGTPEGVRTYTRYSETDAKDTEYVVCGDLGTLVWLANPIRRA